MSQCQCDVIWIATFKNVCLIWFQPLVLICGIWTTHWDAHLVSFSQWGVWCLEEIGHTKVIKARYSSWVLSSGIFPLIHWFFPKMWLWNLMKPDEIITDILVVIGITGIDPDVWRLFRSLVACTYLWQSNLACWENPTCIFDFPFKPGNRCPAMRLNARCFLHFENKGPIGTARACQRLLLRSPDYDLQTYPTWAVSMKKG